MKNRKTYRRFYGVDVDESNGGFQLVESAFKKTIVLYRKNLNVNALQLGDMESIITQDVKNLLQREVVARKGMKWNLALKAIMYKPTDPDVVTDPPAVFNTDMVLGLIGSNYEDELKAAYENVIEQIDEYQRNGSGWVLDELVELDVSIVTCTPWIRDDNDGGDEDDYDEENEEGREL